MHGRVVDLVDFYRHHLLQLLHLLLHLHGLGGLIAEALNELAHIGHLLLLVLVGTQLLLATLLAQDDILAVLHPVVDDVATADLEGAVGYIINKGTVVAHQDHCPTPRGQQLLQPLYRLNVQMVGRLVEQQHVGTAQQDLGQLDAHAPSAGELARGAVEVRAQEAKAHQRALNLGLVALGTQHQVAFVFGGVSLHQRHVVVALIVGALVHLPLQSLYAGRHLLDVGKRLLRLLAHGGRVLQHHHLRQIAHGGVGGNGHRARRGVLHPANNLQHGRLARTVLSYQCNAVAVVNHKTCVAKQWLYAKFNFQSFYRNHLLRNR